MLTKTDTTGRLLGQTIEHYRLLQVLGRGGNSTVFLAQDVDDPQMRVAIKVLRPEELATPAQRIAFQTRFMREAHAASRLHHEHILSLFSYGETDGLAYMVMPLLTGGTLASRLDAQQELLPLARSATYVEQLASALDYAHQHGVAHRDVKPSNVLLDAQGKLYLTDFGIAYLFGEGSEALTLVYGQGPMTLTAADQVLGTPTYMAPEQISGEQTGPATDIYALGVMLYLLVTGQLPFQATRPLALAMQHLHEVPRSPRLLRPELPAPAEAAILRALAKQPTDRFPSAGALARAFEAGLTGVWTEGLLPHMSMPAQRSPSAEPVVLPLIPGSRPDPSFQANAPTQENSLAQITAQPDSNAPLRKVLVMGLLLLAILALVVGLSWAASTASQGTSVQHTPSKRAAHAISTPTPRLSQTTVPAGSNTAIGWQDNSVYAVRKSDGTVLWRYNTASKIIRIPKVTHGTVSVYTANNVIYVLRVNDGRVLWYYQPGSGGDGGGDGGGD